MALTQICFEEQAGFVPIEIYQNAQGQRLFELKAPESLSAQAFKHVSVIADALSLDQGHVISVTHPPSVASVGLSFLIVEVLDTSVLARVQVNLEAFKALLDGGGPLIPCSTRRTPMMPIFKRVCLCLSMA